MGNVKFITDFVAAGGGGQTDRLNVYFHKDFLIYSSV